jgi:RimJ/RimL family protein N-acetyltransferase
MRDALPPAHAPAAEPPSTNRHQQELVVRPANLDDLDDLLLWRNDPLTRKMSLNSAFVQRAEHEVWFRRAINDSDRVIYIGQLPSGKLGMCRFEKNLDGSAWEVSINLNPTMRGRHLSEGFLRRCVELFRTEHPTPLVATIKADNRASTKLFLKCGFVIVREARGIAEYALP